MNPYCMFDLCRPRQRLGPRHAFPVTRSRTGDDLPGVGRGNMSDQEDTQIARHANLIAVAQPVAMIAALFAPKPAPRVARPSSATRTSLATSLATSLFSCVTSWKPTTSSLSGFSRPRTLIPTTCRPLTLFRLCSRLLYLTCPKQWPLTQTPLARILP
jgi:hypothetical protein